ncbi:Jag N-terminal domain-containing protein [Lactiplantibacillus plantarum]|nr:Jag N-terminal domain-containing protein [Lactiplantibacillus plantarum]WHQ51540.1 Jag N-terminal domain-containing protein [Lactiplantibacillus plantarum]
MTVFEGNTVAAAIAAGLKQLHRTRDQVEVEVIAEAKKGFLGLGKHSAQVRLTVVPASAAPATTPTSATATAQQSAATESTTAPTMPRPTVRTPKSTPTRQAKKLSQPRPVPQNQRLARRKQWLNPLQWRLPPARLSLIPTNLNQRPLVRPNQWLLTRARRRGHPQK